MIYWRTTAKDRAEWKHLAMHAFLLHFFAANILRINMTGRGREASALINSISLEMATLERSKRRWNRSCRENLGNIKLNLHFGKDIKKHLRRWIRSCSEKLSFQALGPPLHLQIAIPIQDITSSSPPKAEGMKSYKHLPKWTRAKFEGVQEYFQIVLKILICLSGLLGNNNLRIHKWHCCKIAERQTVTIFDKGCIFW